MGVRFLTLSTVLVLSTAAHGATVRLRDFYPFRDGAQWSYDKVGRSVERGPWSTNSTSSWSTAQSDRLAKVSQLISGRMANWAEVYSSSGFSLDQGEYLRVNRLGLALLSENRPGDRAYEIFSNTGNRRLTNQIQTNSRTRSVTRIWGKGSYHGSGGLVRFVGANAATTRVGGFRTIVTPSGTYRALLVTVIECRTKVFATGIRETDDSITRAWLARGVGLVKQVEIERKRQYLNNRMRYYNDTREVSSLTAYHPNGVGGTETPPTLEDILGGVRTGGYESSGEYRTDVDNALAQVLSMASLVSPPPSGLTGGPTILNSLGLDDDTVRETLSLMEMDGAPGEQTFLRLELKYDPAELAARGATADDLRPMWWDEDNQAWILGGTTPQSDIGVSARATEPAHENHVGYWGLDPENSVVWVNINHGGTYGLTVPEPATLALLTIGAGLLYRRR